ncbi:MAG: protein kinase, partial [Myxococcota bacterium]
MLCYRCGTHVPDGSELCTNCGQRFNTGGKSEESRPSSPPHAREQRSYHYKTGDVIARRYKVKGIVGNGEIGEVYRAHDSEIEVDVAVKVLREGVIVSDSEFKRFAAEIKAARKLSHQNIVRVYDVDRDNGRAFYAMQLLEGLTLRKIIQLRSEKGQAFSLQEIEPLFSQIVHALDYAHQFTFHGDLKPENVVVLPDLLKVTDFYLVGAIGRRRFLELNRSSKTTMRYLAPEIRYEKDTAGTRSDIYSLGAMLYEMLTGEAYSGGPISPSRKNRALPSGIDRVCSRALAENPYERYESAGDLLKDINRAIEDAFANIGVTEEQTGPVAVAAQAPAPSAPAGRHVDEFLPDSEIEEIQAHETEAIEAHEIETIDAHEAEVVEVHEAEAIEIIEPAPVTAPVPAAKPVQKPEPVEYKTTPDSGRRISFGFDDVPPPPRDEARPIVEEVAFCIDEPRARPEQPREPIQPRPAPAPVEPPAPVQPPPPPPPPPRPAPVFAPAPAPVRPPAAHTPAEQPRVPTIIVKAHKKNIRTIVLIMVAFCVVIAAGGYFMISQNRAELAKLEAMRKSLDEKIKSDEKEKVSIEEQLATAQKAVDDKKKAEEAQKAEEAKKPAPAQVAEKAAPVETKPAPVKAVEPSDEEKRVKELEARLARVKQEQEAAELKKADIESRRLKSEERKAKLEEARQKAEERKAADEERKRAAAEERARRAEEAEAKAAAVAAAEKAKGPSCPKGMALVNAGTFPFGTAGGDPMRGMGEKNIEQTNVAAFCIDYFEAPNKSGGTPRANLGFSGAQAACKKSGKRLCSEAEWEKACKGPGGLRYPY